MPLLCGKEWIFFNTFVWHRRQKTNHTGLERRQGWANDDRICVFSSSIPPLFQTTENLTLFSTDLWSDITATPHWWWWWWWWWWRWVKLTGRTQWVNQSVLTFLSITLAWTHSHLSCRLRRSSSVVLSWPSGVKAKICCPRSRSCLYISSFTSIALQSSYTHTHTHTHVYYSKSVLYIYSLYFSRNPLKSSPC